MHSRRPLIIWTQGNGENFLSPQTLAWRRSVQFQADILSGWEFILFGETWYSFHNIKVRFLMCHLFSFIYLCSSVQNLLELDCFQHLIHLQPSTPQNKGYGARCYFWLSLLGDPLIRGELSLSNSGPVVDFIHFCLTHTGVSLQQCALTFSGFCYMTPFLILLRTVTVKGARQAEASALNLPFKYGLSQLWLIKLSARPGRDDHCPVIGVAGDTKTTPPSVAGIESHDTFIFSYLLSHIIHTSHSCICHPGFFCLFF